MSAGGLLALVGKQWSLCCVVLLFFAMTAVSKAQPYFYHLVYEGEIDVRPQEVWQTVPGAEQKGRRWGNGRSNDGSVSLFLQDGKSLGLCQQACDAIVNCEGIYYWRGASGEYKCRGLSDLGDIKLTTDAGFSYKRNTTQPDGYTATSTTSTTVSTSSTSSSETTASSTTTTATSSTTTSSFTSSSTSGTATTTTTPKKYQHVSFSERFRSEFTSAGTVSGFRFSAVNDEENFLWTEESTNEQACECKCREDEECKGLYIWFTFNPDSTSCTGLSTTLAENFGGIAPGKLTSTVSISIMKVVETKLVPPDPHLECVTTTTSTLLLSCDQVYTIQQISMTSSCRQIEAGLNVWATTGTRSFDTDTLCLCYAATVDPANDAVPECFISTVGDDDGSREPNDAALSDLLSCPSENFRILPLPEEVEKATVTVTPGDASTSDVVYNFTAELAKASPSSTLASIIKDVTFGPLPVGLSGDSSNGVITGSTSVGGTHAISVGIKDMFNRVGFISLIIKVDDCGPGRCLELQKCVDLGETFDGLSVCECDDTEPLSECFFGNASTTTAPGPREDDNAILSTEETIIVVVAVLVAIVLVVIVTALVQISKQDDDYTGKGNETFMLNEAHHFSSPDGNGEADGLELRRTDIWFGPLMSEGGLGQVFDGRLYLRDDDESQTRRVCIKQFELPEDVASSPVFASMPDNIEELAEREFLRDAGAFATFEHENVAAMLGVATIGDPCLVLFDNAGQGDLRAFLQRNKPSGTGNVGFGSISFNQRIQFAIDIASGLHYLQEKRYVHRDIAARNILVSDGLKLKISDMNMNPKPGSAISRLLLMIKNARKEDKDNDSLGSSGEENALETSLNLERFAEVDWPPSRWMAVECFGGSGFSHASDLWSYGVVLCEIFSEGEAVLKAWPHATPDDIHDSLVRGERIVKPSAMPQALYLVCWDCWTYYPEKRPSYDQIIILLERLQWDDPQATEEYWNRVVRGINPFAGKSGSETASLAAVAAKRLEESVYSGSNVGSDLDDDPLGMSFNSRASTETPRKSMIRKKSKRLNRKITDSSLGSAVGSDDGSTMLGTPTPDLSPPTHFYPGSSSDPTFQHGDNISVVSASPSRGKKKSVLRSPSSPASDTGSYISLLGRSPTNQSLLGRTPSTH